MPRDHKANENRKRAKARRDGALQRIELLWPSEPRESAAGATSFPVKARSENDDALIRDFLARKGGGH